MPLEGGMKRSSVKLRIAKSRSVMKGIQASTVDIDEWRRGRQMLRPSDQLVLTDIELKEEIARVLNCKNVQEPDNLVEFNYAQGCFLPQPLPGNTVVLLNIRGSLLHKDTEEAKKQIALLGIELEELSEEESEPKIEHFEEEEEEEIEEEEISEEYEEDQGGEGAEDHADEDEDVAPPVEARKKLTNQFNFCERAVLTYNNPNRSQETQTNPPARVTFGSLVLQWIIHDAYSEDYAAQQREKEREKKVPAFRKVTSMRKVKSTGNEAYEARLLAAWKTLERMVNLNTYDDIARDYMYWDDPADEFRDEEGTLLPLWKFTYEKTKKCTVTDIMWNPWYYDMFAVCFGSLDVMKQTAGAVCLFTIKNPSYPEHICETQSGVMCVDIHPKYPFMIVIGLFTGDVQIYNVTVSCKYPQFMSNSVNNSHHGIVTKVRWGQNLATGDEMNFYSVATDGKINHWILMQNELALTTIMTLTLDQNPVPGPEGTFIKLRGSASFMAFHPKEPLIFYVGTEEGLIHKCSALYSSSFLFTYQAHHMPVNMIKFNKFNSSIFASCSGDWRVKIWEDERPEPLFVFEFGSPLASVKWAPYSSTVFAASTYKGCLYVFDLNVNKYKAICKQNIVSKRKYILTRLSFNRKMPIIVVGDDKGCVHSLKLSPNLRIPCKAPKKQQHLTQYTLQCMKLDKLLALYREPPTLTLPSDVEKIPD